LIQRLESERKGLELLGRVISISPGHLAARRLRASKLEELASRAWNRATGPDGRILKTQEERAKVALALLDQAEQDYRRAIKDAPYEAALHERFAWLLGTRAIIQTQSGNQAGAAAETRRLAQAHFSRAVSLDPANPSRHRVLALFAFSQSRLPPPATPLRATAFAAVRKAVELDPELLPELLDRALTVTIDREDVQALVPDTPVDRLHLATLLDKKGLRLQADESYQKALALASPGEKPIYHRSMPTP
jgi:tetratricopeptide (TPR) repeat protein